MSLNRPETLGSWSLAARLTAWYAISSFLLVLFATGYLYWSMVSNLDREDDQLLANKIHVLRKVLRERPSDAEAIAQEVEWQRVGEQHMTVFVRVMERSGRIIVETPGMGAQLPSSVFPAPIPVSTDSGHGIEIDTPSGSYRLLAAHATTGATGEPTHLLQLAFDRTFEETLLADYRRNLTLVLSLAMLVCCAGGYALARRGLCPIGDMTAAAGRVSSATLHERLEVAGLPAELAQLAVTFNAMLDRLHESFQRLSRFSADIAHELRTPVNNLRGEAEVALGKARSVEEYRDVLGSSLEEFGRLAQLIDNLLFLARAESPQSNISKECVDVGQELESIRSFYDAAAGEAGVTIVVGAPAGLTALLSRSLFQRAIGNLVMNALAHTPRGGLVTLRALRDADGLRVEVSDTGEGIAAEHLPHVFDRFYRADSARTGDTHRVGLGLALVKSIALLHQGTASIESTPGRGTCVRITFPTIKPGEPGA